MTKLTKDDISFFIPTKFFLLQIPLECIHFGICKRKNFVGIKNWDRKLNHANDIIWRRCQRHLSTDFTSKNNYFSVNNYFFSMLPSTSELNLRSYIICRRNPKRHQKNWSLIKYGNDHATMTHRSWGWWSVIYVNMYLVLLFWCSVNSQLRTQIAYK